MWADFICKNMVLVLLVFWHSSFNEFWVPNSSHLNYTSLQDQRNLRCYFLLQSLIFGDLKTTIVVFHYWYKFLQSNLHQNRGPGELGCWEMESHATLKKAWFKSGTGSSEWCISNTWIKQSVIKQSLMLGGSVSGKAFIKKISDEQQTYCVLNHLS